MLKFANFLQLKICQTSQRILPVPCQGFSSEPFCLSPVELQTFPGRVFPAVDWRAGADWLTAYPLDSVALTPSLPADWSDLVPLRDGAQSPDTQTNKQTNKLLPVMSPSSQHQYAEAL